MDATPWLEDWTIGQLLRHRYPDTRLRRRFQDNPCLDQVTLGQVLRTPFALNDFLSACRTQPHCGDTSIRRLRAMIEQAARSLQAADRRMVTAPIPVQQGGQRPIKHGVQYGVQRPVQQKGTADPRSAGGWRS